MRCNRFIGETLDRT